VQKRISRRSGRREYSGEKPTNKKSRIQKSAVQHIRGKKLPTKKLDNIKGGRKGEEKNMRENPLKEGERAIKKGKGRKRREGPTSVTAFVYQISLGEDRTEFGVSGETEIGGAAKEGKG